MNKVKFYAVILDGKYDAILKAKTLDALQDKIIESTRLSKGIQPKGTEYTTDDYMRGKKIAQVTIEYI